MNTDQMHGHWREVKGWALEHLGRVTNDPWKRIAGRRERLLGRLEASLAEPSSMAETTFPAAQAAAPAAKRRRAALPEHRFLSDATELGFLKPKVFFRLRVASG